MKTAEKILDHANTLIKSSNFSEALNCLNEGYAAYQHHAEITFKLAYCLYRLNQSDKAMPLLLQAVKLNPELAEAHVMLGAFYNHLNKIDESFLHLEKAQKIAPAIFNSQHMLVNYSLNLERIQERSQKISEVIFELPSMFSRLQIEVTTWCNLKCAGCPRTIDIGVGTWKNVHMPLNDFKHIVDELPPSLTLCLQGVGESTLHPDFLEIVRYARASKKYQHLTLNTNALAKPIEFYASLKEAGLSHISISVDSFDPEIAEACRSGTKVEKLHDKLVKIRELFLPKTIMVSVVVSKRNLRDLPNTLSMLNAIGSMTVETQALITYEHDKGDNHANALDANDYQEIQNLVSSKQLYPNLNLYLLNEPSVINRETVRCNRPFLSPYITAQGYLTPCCTCEDPSVLGHANVLNTRFSDVWKSEKVQNWLRTYTKHSDEICRNCCFFKG